MSREERTIRTLTYVLRHGKIVEKYGSAVMFLRKEEIEDFEALYKALQERPKGRWILDKRAVYNAYIDDFEEYPHYNCSLCDMPIDWEAPFCPACGASMRESEQE